MNAWEICEMMGFFITLSGEFVRIYSPNGEEFGFFAIDKSDDMGTAQKLAAKMIFEEIGVVVAKAFN